MLIVWNREKSMFDHAIIIEVCVNTIELKICSYVRFFSDTSAIERKNKNHAIEIEPENIEY